jgi:hypothetical protein
MAATALVMLGIILVVIGILGGGVIWAIVLGLLAVLAGGVLEVTQGRRL